MPLRMQTRLDEILDCVLSTLTMKVSEEVKRRIIINHFTTVSNMLKVQERSLQTYERMLVTKTKDIERLLLAYAKLEEDKKNWEDLARSYEARLKEHGLLE